MSNLFGVKYVEKSQNSKTGECDATYIATSKSCPSTCLLKDNGCYAKLSYVGIINSKLNNQSLNLDSTKLAINEAKVINRSYGGGIVPPTKLRLHVSGDCRTEKAADIVSNAAMNWLSRGGKNVWSYTHSWKVIPRSTWKDVSILASVDDPNDLPLAREMGYAPSVIVPCHEKRQSKNGIRLLPCRAQVESITCQECMLCFKSKDLYNNKLGIAFAAHGIQSKRILTVLKG